MNMNELLRRDVIRVIGLGGAGLLVVPGAALGQSKTPFRMDETNAIHFMAGHFIPRFLSKPIEWEFKQFATSGQGRVSAFVRGAVDGIMTSWTYLVQIAFNDLPGTCLAGMAGGCCCRPARRSSHSRICGESASAWWSSAFRISSSFMPASAGASTPSRI
jgi:hypothetical protein